MSSQKLREKKKKLKRLDLNFNHFGPENRPFFMKHSSGFISVLSKFIIIDNMLSTSVNHYSLEN